MESGVKEWLSEEMTYKLKAKVGEEEGEPERKMGGEETAKE